jgi:hypothetical protein
MTKSRRAWLRPATTSAHASALRRSPPNTPRGRLSTVAHEAGHRVTGCGMSSTADEQHLSVDDDSRGDLVPQHPSTGRVQVGSFRSDPFLGLARTATELDQAVGHQTVDPL